MGATLSPSQTTSRLTSLADFVFPVSSNVEPGGKGPLIKLFEKYLPCSFIILISLTLLEHDQKISLFQLFILIK